jgi:hypothetical protein
MRAPAGTLISFATQPGHVAQELADAPKSVQTVPMRRRPYKQRRSRRRSRSAHAGAADHEVARETLPSHAEPVDVCARYGGHRVFMRGHHAMWKCVYQTRKQ